MDNGFLSHLKKNKKIFIAGFFALLGIFLIFTSSLANTHKSDDLNQEITLDEYKKVVENEISSLCSAVDGVGKCKVFITFERGEQNVYKGSSVIETKPPKVQGVTVVCRGADSDTVRSQLTLMMTALFDIGSNRVAILKLN